MTLKITLCILAFFYFFLINAQEVSKTPKGKVIGKVFFNHHIDATENAEQTSAFQLTRVYFGYKYNFDDKFSAKIILDAGKVLEGSDHSIFVKNAQLDYKAETWLTFTAGIFGLKQFKDQEKFWGYRYIYKSLDDEYKFGSSADLGFQASVKINKELKLDFLIVNGEGYKKLQDQSGNNRYGLNFVYSPTKNWLFKAYYDTTKGIDIDDNTKETTISNVAFFAGYKTGKIRIGAEYNLMQNAETFSKAAKNKNLQGLSFYSTYIINEKWNIFGRYDQLASNKLSGEVKDWNFSKDGSTIITGFEYKPAKKINTSINYRFTAFEDPSNNNASLVYFNLEFYF